VRCRDRVALASDLTTGGKRTRARTLWAMKGWRVVVRGLRRLNHPPSGRTGRVKVNVDP
jgi:hypothetical protein